MASANKKNNWDAKNPALVNTKGALIEIVGHILIAILVYIINL